MISSPWFTEQLSQLSRHINQIKNTNVLQQQQQ